MSAAGVWPRPELTAAPLQWPRQPVQIAGLLTGGLVALAQDGTLWVMRFPLPADRAHWEPLPRLPPHELAHNPAPTGPVPDTPTHISGPKTHIPPARAP